MSRRRAKPSKEAVRKARLHKLVNEYQEESRYLCILSISSSEVIFIYGGHKIEFIKQEGKITRDKVNTEHLTFEDWTFLFKLAEELMEACLVGSRRKKRKSSKNQS